MSSGIITLDVSGELFETTLATLSKFPNSLLAIMFAHSENGLPAMPKTQNGHYFLEVDPDSFRIILKWLRPGGDLEKSLITKGVLELADYLGLQDFPKPKPTPIDELITLDLNGEKKIKILKRTITRHSKTNIAKFFKGETSECKNGPMPIIETQPGHYFVDRPANNSEMFFSFLKRKAVDEAIPYSAELEGELKYYGFKNERDFYRSKVGDGSLLSWQEDDLYEWQSLSSMVVLDLNGDKEIKILRNTLTNTYFDNRTYLELFFSGYKDDLPYEFPIYETQPGHYFVDRPSERSEAVFNLLKGSNLKSSGEIKSELALYGYILNEHYIETGPNKDLLTIITSD